MEAQEQPRNGGRFAAKAKPEPPAPGRIETPAHDRIAAMKAKRLENPSGHLVEPPVPLAALSQIGQVRHGHSVVHDGGELRSIQLVQHLYAWLTQTAAEGMPGDLELAWRAFDPPVSNVKMHHRSVFDKLMPECLHRAGQLGLAMDRERGALNAEEGRRRAIELARERLAKAELELEVEMPAKLAAQRQALAEMEAAA